MPERTDRDLIGDMCQAVRRILWYVEGMTYEAFVADSKTQDAVIRNMEILGEATKRLSGDLRERRPELPWRQMAGLRDRLIHHYFGVNTDIVLQINELELPRLLPQLEAMASDSDRG